MTNRIVLVTHGKVGSAMLEAAQHTLGREIPEVSCITVSAKTKLPTLAGKISQLAQQQPEDKVLILTDLFGATPCNMASKIVTPHSVAVITGLNMGMLLRSLNYIHCPFDELVEKALDGGIHSIKALSGPESHDCKTTDHYQ